VLETMRSLIVELKTFKEDNENINKKIRRATRAK